MIKVEDERVTRIDRDAKSAYIPLEVKCIGQFAYFNDSLVSLNLGYSNIKIIEKFAFSHCFSLQSVSLPSCLEKICEGSFQYCQSLEEVTFGENPQLREIGDNAFRNCRRLERFKFPPLLEIIGDDSFTSCIKIKTFDLRSTKVQKVGNFVEYRENAAIYLPASVSTSSIVESGIYLSIRSNDGHPSIKRDECGYMFCDGKIFQSDKRRRHILIRRGIETIANNCFRHSNLVSITIPASVTKISQCAFFGFGSHLKNVRFSKNSQLKEIESRAFDSCLLISKILFPKSLKILRSCAFAGCKSLEQVIFPKDSHLEEIESAFNITRITQLSLPPSIKRIKDVCYGMNHLESIYVNNDFYKNNQDGTAIYSNNGRELVCVINRVKHFEIPGNVSVIKSNAFVDSQISGSLTIPSSVEIIESRAFLHCDNLKVIEFSSRSRLKSLECDSLCKLDKLIINNDNFITRKDGVVISLNPPGIVFVPMSLTDLKVDFKVEVIHSYAFYGSRIQNLNFPKSLKKIESNAFQDSELRNITFEEGTELDYIKSFAFRNSKIQNLKLPLVKDHLESSFLCCDVKSVEFPPNFNPSHIDRSALSGCRHIFGNTCPSSSLYALARINFNCTQEIIENQ